MSDTITKYAIEDRVNAIAAEIVEECETLEETHDRVWETVDSLDWIIYTYKAEQVVNESGLASEALDRLGEMGYELSSDSLGGRAGMLSKMAFAILEMTVSKRVQELWDAKD